MNNRDLKPKWHEIDSDFWWGEILGATICLLGFWKLIEILWFIFKHVRISIV